MRTSALLIGVAALVAVAAAACSAGTPFASMMVKEEWRAEPDGWTRGPRAHPETPLDALIFVRQTNLDVLESELYAVSDPRSERYGKHLSLDEVNRLVAPATESIVTVLAWLQFHGIDTASQVRSNGNADTLRFTTDVRTMEAMLGAEYHIYKHTETGSIAVRTHERYSLPEEVHRHIDIVGPTVRFPSMWSASIVEQEVAPEAMVTPSLLRQLYSVGPVSAQSATGVQGVASFLGQFMSQADLQTFYSKYDSEAEGRTPTIIGPNQESNPGVEASLDIQYLTALGNNVTTQFWSTPGEQPGNPGSEPFLVWLANVGNATNAPQTFSASYGDNENTVVPSYAQRANVEFQKAGARGISLMFSSGDGGVGGGQPTFCSTFIPTFPAASPYVTAVGGTDSGSPEQSASLSSGGFSNYWPRPSYQTTAVDQYFKVATNLPPAKDYNQTGAGFPDVAAGALNFAVVQGGFTQSVAGTSCAAPAFSGVVALLNDARFQQGKGSLGWLNPLIYQNPDMFNDVTSGPGNSGCFTNGFTPAAGWDPITGFGTPNYQKMVKVVTALQ